MWFWFGLLLTFYCKTHGLSITEDIAEQIEVENEDSSLIHFESGQQNNDQGKSSKNLDNLLQKPTQIWNVPNELSIHPSSCEQYTYCEREDRPAEGVYRRLPIYPWWYYSCEGNKVKCQPCPSTEDLDHPTLFFSERCQKCISEFKDEKIACPPKTKEDEKTSNWTKLKLMFW
ncbi:uncharacterized protein [Clytia hemisphaerica]|uniref:Cnidarian restricted protein n=1 Tax=Clytia hemisphaerica TaxID=252671 RepID=A0A7M5V0G6_9CNID|eukprot:TCONS_00015651-protein